MTDALLIFITTKDSGEAAKIAQTLVNEKLAACCNLIDKIRSIYSWEGKLCDEGECLLVAKTTTQNYERLEKRVRELHSYDVPEILACPVSSGSAPYLQWLADHTLSDR